MINRPKRTISISSENVFRILAITGFLTAFALRIFRLGLESLWYDETVSAYLARLPLRDMLAHTALDIHPPGYYALLHGWSAVTQAFSSHGLEFLLAYPSVWFGILSIALLAPIGRLMLGRTPTALAIWLAAINPFLVWYSQEVRMYTAAATFGLLCLLAALNFSRLVHSQPSRNAHSSKIAGWLALYALAAGAGLYTLYYFAFALLAINIAVLASLFSLRRHGSLFGKPLIAWISAQIVAALLFAYWLPAFVRQALEPPVPAWRTPWANIPNVLQDVAAGLSASVVGQSIPSTQSWFWAALALLLYAAYYGYAKARTNDAPFYVYWLPLYTLVPPAAILLISAIAPIFHVRYLAVYAPAFALVSAAGLVFLYSRLRIVSAIVATTLVIGAFYSMARFWHHPDYRPDDHRAAVARLAGQWRPGDVILSNAGWVYTALDVYWPSAAEDAGAVPPGPIQWRRLTDVAAASTDLGRAALLENMLKPVGVTTGSVDGEPSLGWGSDEADFYTMSAERTIASLVALGEKSPRIWHYRLYDTVNDPDGLIRKWLESNATLESDTPYAGSGFLRLQEYETKVNGIPNDEPAVHTFIYSEGPILDVYSLPETTPAGALLYVPTTIRRPPDSGDSALAVSLRLIDSKGKQLAQQDEAVKSRDDSRIVHQVFALPIPANTLPGTYEIQLVLYHAEDLQPLARLRGEAEEQTVALGEIEVIAP